MFCRPSRDLFGLLRIRPALKRWAIFHGTGWHKRCSLDGKQPINPMKFPKKILLIDHEPGVTRLIRRALERAGKYLIREEHDDKLALNAARWFQPDLILVDTADKTQQIIERAVSSDSTLKDTPVLSLTSLRPESEMVSGGILSGYSFFAAPIKVEEVLRGVDELMFGKD